MNQVIKDKLSHLPKEPGIYLMKDADGTIIYVGKAKNLKNRVASYFQDSKDHSAKTQKLVSKIENFDIMLVHSEVDALLLERTMIKHHSPKYNILFRDDKEYPYVRVNFADPWPRIQKVRRRKNDQASYYGPFGNPGYLAIILQMIHRIFPLIKCSEYEFKNAKRPCNYYHMKMCVGSCCYDFSRESYLKILHNAIDFLQGKNKLLLKNLKEQMQLAALEERFEEAAMMRDQLFAFENIAQKQTIIVNEVAEGDVIGFAQIADLISIHIMHVREGIIVSKDNFILDAPIQNQEESLFEFLVQYYENRFLPSEILLPFQIPDQDVLSAMLSAHRTIKFEIPKKDDKLKLVEMANRNAQYALDEDQRQHQSQHIGLEILKEKLALETIPTRIECIDISNIQGTAIVASCVCFINGKPAKDQYRLYNIEDQATSADDFGSITKVVTRRLTRGAEMHDLPDLLVIDGGKGQLNAALSALVSFPTIKLKIVSLAKSRLKSFDQNVPHHSSERVFLNPENDPLPLLEGSPEFRILTHLRDEAHRFAISHHRKRRAKVLHSSLLDEVPGIGAKMKNRLYEMYGDIEKMQQISLEEFEQIKGLKKSAALALFTKLRMQTDN